MKIAQLTPGSGKNFYCENCQRDITVVRALRKQGCDMLMMPLYLPLQAPEGRNPANTPVFFGGINVYLQQKMSIFRKSPRWFDKLFDSRRLLEMVSRRATMVDAASLGETTISMLMGEDGRQVKELDRLTDWLAQDENKPDVICLSNILLAGLVRKLKARLGVPIVCLLQDEDEFIDSLPDDYSNKTWEILRQRSEEIDLFIAVSDYYGSFMRERLSQPGDKFRVVPMGIDISEYSPRSAPPERLCVGYLSRMCPGKGLDILVDAFVSLKKKTEFKDLRLKIGGGLAGEDHIYVDGLKAVIEQAGVTEDVEFHSYIESEEKLDFLRSLSVVCVPERRPPAYGLYVLEAFASAVPAVEPDLGVFPELLAGQDKPGIIYGPNTAVKLCEALETILLDNALLEEAGKNARKKAENKFDISLSVEKLKSIFNEIAG